LNVLNFDTLLCLAVSD